MAHDVFISHSAKNRDVADAICAALEKAGIRVWVAPRDVRPGRSFPGEITRAIQQSKVMLLVFSSHSNNSEQVLREVQLATDSRLPLVRFRIEDVSMNDDLKYFLSTPHWLDALTEPLSGHIARLEIAIKELLEQSVEVTGKDVEGDRVPSMASGAASPPKPPPPPPPSPSVPPPPIPRESITAASNQPGPIPTPSKTTTSQTAVRKSATPWILIGVVAVAVLAGVILLIFVVALQQPKASSEQASATTSPAPQLAQATPSSASSPAHVAKEKQKSNSQASRQSKTATPSADSQSSTGSQNESAFERAGSLTGRKDEGKNEEKSEPKNPFERAGGGVDSEESDEASTEPSPDDE